MQRTAPNRRTNGKALTPCIALVDKGGKGFPFKHIVRSVLVDAIPHHSSEAITMNTFDAVGIAEGWIDADSEEQVIEAWQTLVDTGLCWRLQGWFGRTAAALIEQGVVLPANRSTQEA